MTSVQNTLGWTLALMLAVGCGETTSSDDTEATDEVVEDTGAMYDCDDGQLDAQNDAEERENATRAARPGVVADASAVPFPDEMVLERTSTVVTADFINHSISVLDLERLMESGGCRDSALVREVKFADELPPAFAVEITADGKRAVIAASAEWLQLAPLIAGDDAAALMEMIGPQAEGGVISVVDIETGEQLAHMPNSGPPMLIAITPDGTRAFTANAQAGTMTVVDLEALEIIDELDVGGNPEVVIVSPDGKYGIVNQATAGTITMFETADPAGTMSDPVNLGTDTSDMAWIEGRPDTIVASLSFKNSAGGDYVVVDVSDPTAPEIIERGPDISGLGILTSVPFVVTPIPGTSAMVMSAAEQGFSEARVSRVDFSVTPSVVEWTTTVPARGITMGIAVDPTGTVGLAGLLGEREMLKINLEDGALDSMHWMDQLGPSYIAIH